MQNQTVSRDVFVRHENEWRKLRENDAPQKIVIVQPERLAGAQDPG